MKMKLVLFFILISYHLKSQHTFFYSQLIFTDSLVDTFSFPKKWNYPEGVFKDESTGKFENMYGDKIRKKDTVHLHYTAQCTTDLQGGYEINYAYTYSTKDSAILIHIQDGLPAYASYFEFFIKNDSFSFMPKTIYPMHIPGEKTTYTVLQQKLIVKKNYFKSKIFLAEVEVLFQEKSEAPNRETVVNSYYLKGTIRTPIKKINKNLKDFSVYGDSVN